MRSRIKKHPIVATSKTAGWVILDNSNWLGAYCLPDRETFDCRKGITTHVRTKRSVMLYTCSYPSASCWNCRSLHHGYNRATDRVIFFAACSYELYTSQYMHVQQLSAAKSQQNADHFRQCNHDIGDNPNNSKAYLNRSICYMRLHNYEEVLNDAMQSTKLNDAR